MLNVHIGWAGFTLGDFRGQAAAADLSKWHSADIGDLHSQLPGGGVEPTLLLLVAEAGTGPLSIPLMKAGFAGGLR